MEVIIVGSGASAAGAAIALASRPEVKITVLDLGARLEDDHAAARDRMADTDPAHWSPQDLATITHVPRAEKLGRLPRKQIYASDFPFADVGQLSGVSSRGLANALVISGAYGGFSNTWGAQVLVYADGTFERWPFGRALLEPHYRAILSEIPYAGEDDDLSTYFPLVVDPQSLPAPSTTTEHVLARYARHRGAVNRRGVTVGNARLALDASRCVRCGLCMTGCPYQLIYSASQTFDRLIAQQRVTYVADVEVLSVHEDPHQRPTVTIRQRGGRERRELVADRVFLGAGAIGTTRIVANSLALHDVAVPMEESAQFLAPFLSLRRTATLQQAGSYTLNQFNMLINAEHGARDAALIHGYPYNDISARALPSLPWLPLAEPLRRSVLRRLTVGLGYLPSWQSPQLQLRFAANPDGESLPNVRVDWTERPTTQPAFRAVLRALRRVGPLLDLHPIPTQTRLSPAAKSYHFGGSFAHAERPNSVLSSDLLGRVGPWKSVHLIDASVFPTVPATTITLTIMANAHRIATSAVSEPAP